MASIHNINVGGTSYDIVDSKNIANVETASTASQAYAVDDYVIWNDQLYRVTKAIAKGAAFVINTNIVATKVGAEFGRFGRNDAIEITLAAYQALTPSERNSGYYFVKTAGGV